MWAARENFILREQETRQLEKSLERSRLVRTKSTTYWICFVVYRHIPLNTRLDWLRMLIPRKLHVYIGPLAISRSHHADSRSIWYGECEWFGRSLRVNVLVHCRLLGNSGRDVRNVDDWGLWLISSVRPVTGCAHRRFQPYSAETKRILSGSGSSEWKFIMFV